MLIIVPALAPMDGITEIIFAHFKFILKIFLRYHGPFDENLDDGKLDIHQIEEECRNEFGNGPAEEQNKSGKQCEEHIDRVQEERETQLMTGAHIFGSLKIWKFNGQNH